MYNSWLLYEWAKERQREFLKEAEMERLIRKYQSKSKRSFNGLRFLLNNLGKILITWGLFLQKCNSEITHI